MTHEEQQEIFDAIMTRSAAPGTFSPYTGVYLTALSDGGAEAELVLAPHHMNPMGIVHGGVYCTLMDHVAGAAACTRGSRCLTVDCETRFIGIPAGEKLCGHARAVRMGRHPLRRGHLHLPQEGRLPEGINSAPPPHVWGRTFLYKKTPPPQERRKRVGYWKASDHYTTPPHSPCK